MTEHVFSRRDLLKRLGMAGSALVALPGLSQVLLFQREALARQASQGERAVQGGALSTAELAILAAACARIIPTDEHGPGATEARAAQVHRPISWRMARAFARGLCRGIGGSRHCSAEAT